MDIHKVYVKGLSIKDVRSRGVGGGEVVQCGHEGRGVFRCGRSHFLVENITDFLKFMVCPHGQGGWGLSQCGHFADKGGRGSICHNFVRTSFMDDL